MTLILSFTIVIFFSVNTLIWLLFIILLILMWIKWFSRTKSNTIFLNKFYSKNARKLHFHIFLHFLQNIWYHNYALKPKKLWIFFQFSLRKTGHQKNIAWIFLGSPMPCCICSVIPFLKKTYKCSKPG